MLEAFIHVLEVALLSLVILLIFRVRSLYIKSTLPDIQEETAPANHTNMFSHIMQKKAVSNSDYESKMQSLKKAQVFAASQLLEIKRNYGDLKQQDLEWLREAISLYLIGAIDYIGKDSQCGIQNRRELIELVLKSNLSLDFESSNDYFNEALYRKLKSDNDLMIRAGARAAKFWLQKEKVPNDISLISQLDDWGVFA